MRDSSAWFFATNVTLKGLGFVARSRVYYDGMAVPYRWVSPTEIQLQLDANILATAGRHAIVVKNLEPIEFSIWGNGTSNTAYLIVKYK